MVGLNGINIALGYGLASYMGLAFYYTNDPVSQWRTPLGIALIWPVMMIVVCLIAPESPRYLLMKGRIEEAKNIVLRLHKIKGDPDNEFAESEFYQMSKQAEIDRTLDPGWVSIMMSLLNSADFHIDRALPEALVSQTLHTGDDFRVHRSVDRSKSKL